MKLYGSIKSERAETGQGGNEFLEIEITNEKRQKVALVKVTLEEKIKIIIGIDKDLTEVEINN